MKTTDAFAHWFIEHDKHVLASHVKKDRDALERSLKELEAERDRVRSYHDRLESLVDSARQLGQAVGSPMEGEH